MPTLRPLPNVPRWSRTAVYVHGTTRCSWSAAWEKQSFHQNVYITVSYTNRHATGYPTANGRSWHRPNCSQCSLTLFGGPHTPRLYMGAGSLIAPGLQGAQRSSHRARPRPSGRSVADRASQEACLCSFMQIGASAARPRGRGAAGAKECSMQSGGPRVVRRRQSGGPLSRGRL